MIGSGDLASSVENVSTVTFDAERGVIYGDEVTQLRSGYSFELCFRNFCFTGPVALFQDCMLFGIDKRGLRSNAYSGFVRMFSY